MEIGPVIMMEKKQFLRIRGRISNKIIIAEDAGKKTFLHVVYNGPAQICRNPKDAAKWNTVFVPLKD